MREKTIVKSPTNDDKVICWKKLWTKVELITLKRTNIMKLIIVMEAKWINPPAITFMYSPVYVKCFVNISAEEAENGLLLNRCVRITKVIGPHKYMNLWWSINMVHWSIVFFTVHIRLLDLWLSDRRLQRHTLSAWWPGILRCRSN